MQSAVIVAFSKDLPDRERLRTIVEGNVGSTVTLETGLLGHPERPGILLLPANGNAASFEYDEARHRVIVEVGQSPSYLEWAVVRALQELGGLPNRSVPDVARKRLAELTWLERRPFLSGLLGLR